MTPRRVGMPWRRSSTALAVLAASAVLSFASRSSADLSPGERARRDVVLATVGPRTIRVGELEDRLAAMPDFQRAQYGATEPEVRKGVLQRMLIKDALVATAAEADITDPLVKYEVARARSNATLRELAKKQPEPKQIPEADVAAYYAAHESSYRAPPRIQVWRILVATAAEAEAILAAMQKDGTPDAWAKLCREKSLDEATKLRRGTLGFLAPDGSSSEAGVKAPVEMVQAALTVSDGEIVPKPIVEGDKLAVVWRRGSTPARSQTLQAAEPEIRRTLTETRFREVRDALVARLRAERVRGVDDSLVGGLTLADEQGVVKVHAPKNP